MIGQISYIDEKLQKSAYTAWLLIISVLFLPTVGQRSLFEPQAAKTKMANTNKIKFTFFIRLMLNTYYINGAQK